MLAFSIGHVPPHNFLLKCTCCRFAQAIGFTSDPRITFPYLLKTRASTLGLCAVPAGSRTATASLAWWSHQPRRATLHPSASASASNRRRARRTVAARPLAISSIGAFRTPAVGARGWVVMQASENLYIGRNLEPRQSVTLYPQQRTECCAAAIRRSVPDSEAGGP